MLNNLVLMGRLTKDPQTVKVGELTIIVNFDIAVDNIRKEADGTRGTSFFSVVCFNTIAENVAQHLHKGSKVAVVEFPPNEPQPSVSDGVRSKL